MSPRQNPELYPTRHAKRYIVTVDYSTPEGREVPPELYEKIFESLKEVSRQAMQEPSDEFRWVTVTMFSSSSPRTFSFVMSDDAEQEQMAVQRAKGLITRLQAKMPKLSFKVGTTKLGSVDRR